jgi:methionyl-tRNA formyltransferase
LSRLSAETVGPVINDFIYGRLQRIPQDRNKATYTRKMNKIDGEVNWKNKSEKIYNLMRGTIPYPGAYSYYHGKKLKIIQAKRISGLKEVGSTRYLPGSVVAIKKDGLFIATGDDGMIKIEKLIPAGAKEMTAGQFINGYKIKIGDRLFRENV